QPEDGIRDRNVTGVQTCALPIYGCTLQILAKCPVNSDVISSIFFPAQLAPFKPSSALFKSLSISFGAEYSRLKPGITTSVLYTRSEERRVGKDLRYR